MTCTDWTDDGKGGAYRVVGDLIALRVRPARLVGKRRGYAVRVERPPVAGRGHRQAARRPELAQVVMPWIEATARSKGGAIAEAEAHGRRVIAAELAALDGGI